MIALNLPTIGLPRALLYYRYQDLWKTFFEELGCRTVVSDKSNQELLEMGMNYSIDEACLSLKLYLGHVASLKDQCDYVLIPRLLCLKKHEKLCTNFNALYDLVHNIFPHLSILHYNIDISKKETECFAFLKMGRELGFSYLDSIRAYQKAKQVETEHNQRLLEEQQMLLEDPKPKILLVAHAYNLYDPMIGQKITSFLKENQINVIYADRYDHENIDEECALISKSNYWTFNKELLASISHYKKQVDGIILLSTFPCGPDSLSNEMCLRKVKGLPILSLIIDESNAEAGIITRLESFIDVIEEKRKRSAVHETRESC